MSETVGRTLEEKREWALEGKARWEERLARAEARGGAASELGGGIPGFGGSGNQRAARQVRSALNSADRAWKEASEKLEYYATKLRYYERTIAERDRTRLTRGDLTGSKFVRTPAGWRKVVRVNAKTVSVESGYSWVDRLDFDKILGVR
ncbi:MAG: hypothetical protein JWP32_2918 [Schumannella sp.]|nr:hypothetical protein [Schumannella sp.]